MLSVQFVEKNSNPIKSIIKNVMSISNVHFNSKEILENGMFFAFTQGERDGHLFIQDAIENGATTIILSDASYISDANEVNYILVQDTYQALWELAKSHRAELDLPFICITGSNGKTTTKDILFQILSDKNKVFKTPKNLNNHIGVPLNILNIDNTFDFAILELGMNHAGEIDLLAALVKPSISVITNIGESHIEYLGSTENIARAKGEIIPHTADSGFIVMNHTINHKDVLMNIDSNKTIRFVGIDNEDAELAVRNIDVSEDGSHFFIENDNFFLPLKGIHNIENALLAILVAQHFGFTNKRIADSLRTIDLTGMRYEYIQTAHKALIINDAYNASPTSVKASVKTFLSEKSDKILVLGDIFELGALSKSLHEKIGTFLNQYASEFKHVITIGEDSIHIHNTYIGEKTHFSSIEAAQKFIENFLDEEVSLLFKASRGMRFENIINALNNKKAIF